MALSQDLEPIAVRLFAEFFGREFAFRRNGQHLGKGQNRPDLHTSRPRALAERRVEIPSLPPMRTQSRDIRKERSTFDRRPQIRQN